MKKSIEALRESIGELHLRGRSVQDIRDTMVRSGWDVHSVDHMLWKLNLRDRHNTFFRSRFKRAFVGLLIIVGLTALVSGTLSFERYQKNQQQAVADPLSTGSEATSQDTESEAVNLRGQSVVSDLAGISFDYPSDWTVSEFDPQEIGGAYQWQIEDAKNKPIKEALQQKYDIDNANEDTAKAAQVALLNDPAMKNLTTVTITLYPATDYVVESSLEEWRSSLEESSRKIGYLAEAFTNITISGVPGYSYTSRLSIGQLSSITSEVVLLDAPKKRIEISIFPHTARQSAAVEAILSSLTL